MPLVVDVMQGHKQALLQKEAAQMASMARKWGDVESAVQDKVEVFVNRVKQDGLTPGQLASRQFQLDRYASLLAQVQKEHAKYVDFADGSIQAGQKQFAAAGIKAAGDAIRAVGADYGVKMAFDILPIDAVEFMVGLAGDGSPLRDLLTNAFASGAQGMLDQLIRATALGRNPQATARQMVRDGLSQSLSRMMNIARTEQLRVHRESSRQQYTNSGVVESYRRLATKDRRVCAACLMADGETYELTESLKEHASGRCVVKETLVHTERGLMPIERVKVGDFVLTHTGQYKRVTNTAKRYYTGDVVTLRKDGHSVTVTPEHKIYTGSDWIEARAVTTFWTLNDVLERASSLKTFQPSEVKRSSFLRSSSSLRPALCHRGSNSTASLASTKAKSMLYTSTAYSLTGDSLAACMASSNSFSLSLEYLCQLACLVKAALSLDSLKFRLERKRSNASGSLSFWRLAASLAEMGAMSNRRMSRINDLVLMLASAVNSLYVAFSSTYRRRNQAAAGSPSCSDNLSIHAEVLRDMAFCIDFFKPNAFARWWTDFFVRPSNMPAISSAFIDQKLLRITSSSWVVHNFPGMGTIIHRPCVSGQEYSGMVYDLTVSDDHSFIAGGVVVHNCTSVPTVMGFKPVQWERGPDWLMKQDPAVQRKILGAGRFQGWKDGKFDLDQIIAEKPDPTWGNSLHPASLKDLLSGNNTPYRVRLLDPNHFTPLPSPPRLPTVPQLPPPDQQLIWSDQPLYEGQELNGVPLTPATPDYWLDVKDVKFKNKKEPALPTGGAVSTGLVVVEPDGRAWVVEPKNHFGGYEHTFAKGRKEPNLTAQQNALKEAYEEMGLSAEITGMIGDFKGTTTTTRYYLAKRTGGAPWQHGWETENVKLVPMGELDAMLNMQRDKDVLAAAQKLLNAPPPKERKPRTPKVTPEPTQAPPSVAPVIDEPDTFPSDLQGLETIRRLGGSTGAELVKDRVTGRMYVKKKGNNPGHLLEETYADAAYRALGVNVPNFKVYNEGGAPVKLAEFMEGKSLADIKQSDPKLYKKAVKELQKDFAADALMGNWDVIGMGADNVLIDKDGKPWRIDNGGSLRYRAQGRLKVEGDLDGSLSPYPDDFWTLRDSKYNPSTPAIFGDMGHYDTTAQLKALGKKRKALLEALPEELRATVGARLDHLVDIGTVGELFKKDKFSEDYANNFAKHMIGLRKAGIIDAMPKKLTHKGTTVFDENKKMWDNYRGNQRNPVNSVIKQVADYINKNGGNYEAVIPSWAGDQAGDSWTPHAQAGKYFYASQREVDHDNTFWWKFGRDQAQAYYDNDKGSVGESVYHETLTAWHAFNYEFMRHTKFEHNDIKRGVVNLYRTENKDVMRLHSMNIGDQKVMKRGAVESYSVFEKVFVFGTEVTRQEIPHHRIFGCYMLERSPNQGWAMFAGDNENEIVAMSEGSISTYEGSRYR